MCVFCLPLLAEMQEIYDYEKYFPSSPQWAFALKFLIVFDISLACLKR